MASVTVASFTHLRNTPSTVKTSSGGLGSLAWPARRRCRWHDLSGDRAGAGNHDPLPVASTHREGFGAVLFEDAQDVGHLLAVVRARQQPADHHPLAYVVGGEPDHEPVTHAGLPWLESTGSVCSLASLPSLLATQPAV